MILKSQTPSTSPRGKNKTFIAVSIAALILALLIGGYFVTTYLIQLREYKKRIADISITNVNLSKIPDGFYTGSYDAIMIAAKVRVDIIDHNIQNITILYHKNERGKKAEVIVKEIKSAQSLNVDTITGATNSSRVILKAVQNALDSGVKA